jgi:protein gp37
MCDVFEDAPGLDGERDFLWVHICLAYQLDWLLLTKRPENIKHMVPPGWLDKWPAHVWLGVTAENQEQADKRIPLLLQVPAAVRFVSVEPMLGPVDLSLSLRKCPLFPHPSYQCNARIDWLIVGGESGPNARPTHPLWAWSLRDECKAAGVPFFYKQNGEWVLSSRKPQGGRVGPDDFGVLTLDGRWLPGTTGWNGRDIDPDTQEAYMVRVGRKAAGDLLDGVEYKQFPVTR